MVGDGFPGFDAEAPPAFAFGGFEALEEVQEGEGGGWLGGAGEGGWWEGGEGWGLLLAFGRVGWGGEGEVKVRYLPPWTDHGSSGAAGGGGALEVLATASRTALDSEW